MIYFISDLHLSIETPGIFRIFKKFLGTLTDRDSLYILGDFFEVWPGDDCLGDTANPFCLEVVEALKQTTVAGVPVFLMHGNRDFLLGDDFARQSGVVIIPDPFKLVLPEASFLLSHGDALCTEDTQYQQFRALTRTAAWQSVLLAKPLQERYAIAIAMREQSEAAIQKKRASAEEYQMDLDPSAIVNLLDAHPCQAFIHGHTHRPGKHEHQVGNNRVERWVLSDWNEEHGQAIVWDGHVLQTIDLN